MYFENNTIESYGFPVGYKDSKLGRRCFSCSGRHAFWRKCPRHFPSCPLLSQRVWEIQGLSVYLLRNGDNWGPTYPGNYWTWKWTNNGRVRKKYIVCFQMLVTFSRWFLDEISSYAQPLDFWYGEKYCLKNIHVKNHLKNVTNIWKYAVYFFNSFYRVYMKSRIMKI